MDHSDANPIQLFDIYPLYYGQYKSFFLILYLKIFFPLSLTKIPYGNPCSIDFFLIADSTFPHLIFQNFLPSSYHW